MDEWYIAAIVLFGMFLVLLLSGLHVGVAFMLAGIIGFFFFEQGLTSLVQTVRIIHGNLFSYALLPIPLFMLMAELLEQSGANQRLYNAVQQWFRWLPGSLPTTSIITCAIFGAACGSDVAATASLGRLMFAQMVPRGVNKRLIAGTVMAGGTLSLLIPPSLALILFGFVTQESIGKLFIGAIIPGVIQALAFSLYIIIRVLRKPELSPPITERVPLRQMAKSSWGAFSVLLVIIGVLGSIYGGIATPGEAGAVGAFLALIIGILVTRELTWSGFVQAFRNTLAATGFIMLLLVGAQVFTRLLSLQGVAMGLSNAIVESGLSPYHILLVITVVYIVLGMLMDGISIIVLSVPILAPILVLLGFDMVWIGVYVVMLINIGLLTPPFALNAFIVRGIAAPYGLELWDIFKGGAPFIAVMVITVILVALFPNLILWLPTTMIR